MFTKMFLSVCFLNAVFYVSVNAAVAVGLWYFVLKLLELEKCCEISERFINRTKKLCNALVHLARQVRNKPRL